MGFVSLDAVLQAIAACMTVPEWAKLDADEPAWLHSANASYSRYSAAASLLDHHLVTTQHAPMPRWLDTREGTGYPRPGDLARDDGMKFLLAQAKWYPQWLKFNREFRVRTLNAAVLGTTPTSVEDYLGNCPQKPDASCISKIGFDAEDIAAFLDRAPIPHALETRGPRETPSISSADAPSSGVPVEPAVHAGLPLPPGNEHTEPAKKPVPSRHVHKTAKSGKRSLIDRALQHAYAAAGEQCHDVEIVFDQLIKLALEYPEKFRPLSRYENGQILFWRGGKETEYTRAALREYISRRLQNKCEN